MPKANNPSFYREDLIKAGYKVVLREGYQCNNCILNEKRYARLCYNNAGRSPCRSSGYENNEGFYSVLSDGKGDKFLEEMLAQAICNEKIIEYHE